MKNEVRPIDANALAESIKRYMKNYRNAPTRLTVCRSILSMLGDENQTPTLTSDHFPDVKKMVPLTLEQLRGMDGQPVWIVESPDWGHWELSEDAEDYLCDRDADLYGLTYPDPDGKAGLHKLGWLAYAYPPAYIDREELESCEVCRGVESISGLANATTRHDWGTWSEPRVEGDFKHCPECGRPLTEKAWDALEKRLRGVLM